MLFTPLPHVRIKFRVCQTALDTEPVIEIVSQRKSETHRLPMFDRCFKFAATVKQDYAKHRIISPHVLVYPKTRIWNGLWRRGTANRSGVTAGSIQSECQMWRFLSDSRAVVEISWLLSFYWSVAFWRPVAITLNHRRFTLVFFLSNRFIRVNCFLSLIIDIRNLDISFMRPADNLSPCNNLIRDFFHPLNRLKSARLPCQWFRIGIACFYRGKRDLRTVKNKPNSYKSQ